MDENPCAEVAVNSDKDLTPLHAALALGAMLDGDNETAERWISRTPRAERGRVKIALDDLDMMISRMGKK